MKTMYKYNVNLADGGVAVHYLRGDIKFTAVQGPGVIAIWAEHDERVTEQAYAFSVHGTGHDIPANSGEYVGTALDGPFVWHVYARKLQMNK